MSSGDEVARKTHLVVRTLELVSEEEVARDQNVFCPFRAESRTLSSCRACPHFGTVAEDGGTLVCRRSPPEDGRDRVGEPQLRPVCVGPESLGARVPVGALVPTTIVCASESTSLATVARHAAEAEAPGVIVVDAQLRPAGFVSREQLASAPRHACMVSVVEQARVEATLHESAPLSEALELLVHEHRRVLVAVDSEGRATGVLSDLELLRWFARTRKRCV
jgi:CBS domain-containing protein